MKKEVIKVNDLVKKYGNFTAVDGVSFEVHKGEIFGLLGENGAGKTTTLEIIEGLRKKSSGRIWVLGKELAGQERDSIKERIGVQLQSSAYYHFLTLREILELFGSFYQKSLSPEELLSMVHLEEKSNSLVGNLSGGQRQRFSIVASLINDPEIVFLDEPTTGLDPLARRNLWDLIAKIKSEGKTIILTTHYMEEAEVLCDRIAIMDYGKILTIGTTHKLVEKMENPFKMSFLVKGANPKIISEITNLGAVNNMAGKIGLFEARFDSQSKLNRALDLVSKLDPDGLTVGRASLEDLFIELTGKAIGEKNA